MKERLIKLIKELEWFKFVHAENDTDVQQINAVLSQVRQERKLYTK